MKYTLGRYVSFKMSGDRPVFGKPVFGDPVQDNDWVLLDMINGAPWNGHGYVWVFSTREAARRYRRKQESNPDVGLSGPFRATDLVEHVGYPEPISRDLN